MRVLLGIAILLLASCGDAPAPPVDEARFNARGACFLFAKAHVDQNEGTRSEQEVKETLGRAAQLAEDASEKDRTWNTLAADLKTLANAPSQDGARKSLERVHTVCDPLLEELR